MPNKTEKYIFLDLLHTAKTIDRWPLQQRKAYLFELVKRELRQEETLYRHVIKLMLVDSKRRKHFIKKIESGKIS